MPKENINGYLKKRKRRIMGEILKGVELKNSRAWLSIHASSKAELMTYESSGLVLSINGSGSLDQGHQQCQEAGLLGKYIASQGGIVFAGGRSSGIMAAVSEAVGDNYAGIVFPEIEQEASKKGQRVLVNSPQPRVEMLATCAPFIVVFRGGLGTMMVLIRAIVHLRNRQYHPDQPLQLVFISNYWIGLLATMMNLGCLPVEFLRELIFFDRAEDILKKIEKFSK